MLPIDFLQDRGRADIFQICKKRPFQSWYGITIKESQKGSGHDDLEGGNDNDR
jgi:hypothetical protein